MESEDLMKSRNSGLNKSPNEEVQLHKIFNINSIQFANFQKVNSPTVVTNSAEPSINLDASTSNN